MHVTVTVEGVRTDAGRTSRAGQHNTVDDGTRSSLREVDRSQSTLLFLYWVGPGGRGDVVSGGGLHRE